MKTFCNWCNHEAVNRCNNCGKNICKNHQADVWSRFKSFEDFEGTRDFINTLFEEPSGQYLINSDRKDRLTYKHFYEKVVLSLHDQLPENKPPYCLECAAMWKQAAQGYVNRAIVPLLEKAQASGLICMVSRFCLCDTLGKCQRCGRFGCAGHLGLCIACNKTYCSSWSYSDSDTSPGWYPQLNTCGGKHKHWFGKVSYW